MTYKDIKSTLVIQSEFDTITVEMFKLYSVAKIYSIYSNVCVSVSVYTIPAVGGV